MGGSIAKMLQGFKGLSWGEIIKAVIFLPLVLPAIALGIALASYALQLVQPIGFVQFFSAILIAGIFAVVSYGIRNMLQAFDGINPAEALVAAIFIPVILPAVALAIAGASKALSLVQPVGLLQWFTSILIGVLFVVLSFGVANIIKAFRGIDPATLLAASIGIPVILVAMSAAIWGSSLLLSKVETIGFFQFLTAIAIAAVFVVISYGIRQIAQSISKMKWGDVPKIPVFFVAISAAIMASSLLLQFTADLTDRQLFTIAALGVTLSGIGFIMGATMKFVGKISLKDLLVGSLGLVIIAGAIMVSSLILSVGNYETYPTLSWIAGVALSLTTFGLAAWVLGASVFGPQALIFLAGIAAVLTVAGTIVGVAKILEKGKYDNKGMLEWAVATSLLYITFTPIIMMLGAMGLAGAVMSFFGAEDPFETAKRYMVQIAETIVLTSKVLAKGTYEGGPTKAWADGISVSLGAFMPVYGMLMKNAILSLFGGGGVGPDDFNKAILTVSGGIVTAADMFAAASASFENPPPVEWADGVGKAISAFSPVYKVLAEQDGWFSDGPSVEDMANAIWTISNGIVDAAYFFAKNKAAFTDNYPPKEWGEGVGAALGAFSPVFEALSGKSWYQSSDDVIYSLGKGIRVISNAIVSAGKIFSKTKPEMWKKENVPSKEWGEGVAGAIGAFSGVFEIMVNESGWFTDMEEVADDLGTGIRIISRAIRDAGNIVGSVSASKWKAFPPKDWGTGVKGAIGGMLNTFDMVYSRGYTLSGFRSLSKILLGGVDAMASTARILWYNRKFFSVKLDPNFVPNISTNMLNFADLGVELEKKLVSTSIVKEKSSGLFSSSETTREVRNEKDISITKRVAASMGGTALILYAYRRFFSFKLKPDWMKSITTNMLSFATLGTNSLLRKFARDVEWINLYDTQRDAFGGEQKDYLGHYYLNKSLWSLIGTARIMHYNRRYFERTIDPNFIKRLSKNIIDYTRLAEYLVQVDKKEKKSETWSDSISNFFGFGSEDPIMEVARGMIVLAKSYDKLASSFEKFGGALDKINIDKIKELKSLQVEKLGNTIEKVTPKEEEQGFWSKLGSAASNLFSGPEVKSPAQKATKEDEKSSLKEDMEKIIELLSGINTSTSIVNDYLSTITEEEIKPPTEL